jgi:hypothetical protein
MSKQVKKLKEDPVRNTPLEKDFAHYPPTSTKQVIKQDNHSAKQFAESSAQNENAGPKNTDIVNSQTINTPANTDAKIVNESNKIVNGENDIYANGSGGAFEATEQVND